MPVRKTDVPAKMPSRRASGVEALLRQVLTQQAVMSEQLESLSRRTDEAAGNAATARELANRTNIILEEQNVLARLGEYRSEVKSTIEAMRQDLVHAHEGLKKELAALETASANRFAAVEARVAKLEADYQQREGIKSLAGWLMKNAPWLFAGIAAFAAGFGFHGGPEK